MKKRTISFVLYVALLVGAFFAGVEVERQGLLDGGNAPVPVVAANDTDTLPCAKYQELPKTLPGLDLSIPVLTNKKDATFATVTEVVDGDTLKLKVGDKQSTVRLVGIDTPEKSTTRNGQVEHFGVEAATQAEHWVRASGNEVYFTYDARSDKVDQYGRTLAYVWVKQGEQYELLNALMVRDGFAYSYYVNRKTELTDLFRAFMVQAMAENRGLWGVCN